MKEYSLKPVEEVEKSDIEISVFLPVFNEQDNIEQLDLRLTAGLKELGRSYEVIYVDDGSTDQSLAKLRKIAARDLEIAKIQANIAHVTAGRTPPYPDAFGG